MFSIPEHSKNKDKPSIQWGNCFLNVGNVFLILRDNNPLKSWMIGENMTKIGLRGAILTSALMFLPIHAKADYLAAKADYLANLSINGKEYISEKDEKMFEGDNPAKGILLNCENNNLEELVLRTFIEEEKENVVDELERLDTSMAMMATSPYTDSRLVVNKLNKLLKASIPVWALAFQNFNPKFLTLEYGLQARSIAKKELKNVDALRFERKEDYAYYSNLFNNLVHIKKLLQANRNFIDDVRQSTKQDFFFTHEEVSDVKNAFRQWDIKYLEIFAGKKIEEYKELSKIEGKKWEKMKETPEYKKYAKNLEFSKKRVNLYDFIKGNYKIRNTPCEDIEKRFPIKLYYNSMHGPEKVEDIELNVKLSKSEVNDKKDSWRIGIFSKNWDDCSKNWVEQYRINFSTTIWIIHPKGTSLDGIMEKSFNIYSKDDAMVGEWQKNLKKEENVGDKLKDYAFDEIMSHFLKGYQIKTKNVAEWIVWKMNIAESENNEKKRQELLEKFKDYIITEIPLNPSGKMETAKYIRFKIDKRFKDNYILLKTRVEKGTFDNIAYGELEQLVSLSKENDNFNQQSTLEEKAYQTKDNSDTYQEIKCILEKIKEISLKANPEMQQYEILEIKKIDDKKAEATVEFVMDYNQGMLPMYMRLTQKNKIYLEKKYVDQEQVIRWKSKKEDKISVNWSDITR